MTIKGKRILKNGTIAGYVKQKDGSWKWRFISKQNGAGKNKKNTKSFKSFINKNQSTRKKIINPKKHTPIRPPPLNLRNFFETEKQAENLANLFNNLKFKKLNQ